MIIDGFDAGRRAGEQLQKAPHLLLRSIRSKSRASECTMIRRLGPINHEETMRQLFESLPSSRAAWQRQTLIGLSLAVIAGAALIVLTRPEPLPDFAAIEPVAERKQAFFGFLAPLVRDANDRIRAERTRLQEIAESAEAGSDPGWIDRRWLAQVSEKYDVSWNSEEPLAGIDALQQRVDVVPVSLALVQAATESGWGRSRFAVEANNLFGHWCYQPGCGLVPSDRRAEARHEVAAFDSVQEAVRRYIWNLNTHEAYQPVREIRARLRRSGQPITAVALADGLTNYSERRDEYVEEIKTVIRVNADLLESVSTAL